MGKRRIVSMADYGVIPDSAEDTSSAFNKFVIEDTAKCATVYRFVKGTYRFYASKSKNEGGASQIRKPPVTQWTFFALTEKRT